jgi:hypothetical protein
LRSFLTHEGEVYAIQPGQDVGKEQNGLSSSEPDCLRVVLYLGELQRNRPYLADPSELVEKEETLKIKPG